MRRLIQGLIIVMVTAACAEASEGVQPDTVPGTSVAATTAPPQSTTTSIPPGPPVAWISPSGVHLAVTGTDGDTVEVLTPCGDPVILSEGSPITTVDVVIDAGHGGPIDTGAVGANGLAEKEINLRVALETHRVLAERGIVALLTRVGDYPIPIPTRSAYADIVGARALVSIHHNAPQAPASNIPGVEIFVQHDSEESQRLGGLLYDTSVTGLSDFDIDWDRAADAGVMTVMNPEGLDAYGMVRLPETPSALIELGYIANPAEADLYLRDEYVKTAASSLADALEQFLTTDSSGAPLVEGRIFSPRSGVGKDQCVDVDLELDLYPDVIEVQVSGNGDYSFSVTISSPYDSAARYADAFRVVGDDGVTYGVRELLHDHAAEQPFTRSLDGVSIPDTVRRVTIEGRDLTYGWGGETVTVDLP